MPDTVFMAIFPKTIEYNDKVILKGRIIDGAKEFSINFANDTCSNPDNITYQLKWLINEGKIVENSLEDGVWLADPKETYYTTDGRLANKFKSNENGLIGHVNITDNDESNKNSYSFLEGKFALEFAFQDDESISVYSVYGDGANLITNFISNFDLADINALQVCGDVDKITELTFLYGH